jgi:hypothetical protein
MPETAMETLPTKLLSDWSDRLLDRPDWGKVIDTIRVFPSKDQALLSRWVDQFRLNPNMALEAAILIEECRLQEKDADLEALSDIEGEKGQLSAVFMKALRTLRRPELEALREQISLHKKKLQTKNAQIHYPDDLEQDEFELRFKVRSMKDWDALVLYATEKRAGAESLLNTIKTGHVES